MAKGKDFTQQEREWLDQLQAVLNDCPSDRLTAFATGDPGLTVFIGSDYEERCDLDEDVPVALAEANIKTQSLTAPFQIWAVRG